jgi:hypothetical protein
VTAERAGSTLSAAEVVDVRQATQRLTSAPLARSADVVDLLCAVQCQERDHALWSLGMRVDGATLASTGQELSDGEILRTHILRPTWHFVLPQDLRWMLAVTSPRVEAKMAGRHRQLGLGVPAELDAAVERVAALLVGRNALTRAEIGAALVSSGDPIRPGEQLGHVLMVAELRGLIVSGPTKGAHHSYVLVDEVVPPAPAVDPDEGLARLVARFMRGHGPASDRDFARWSSSTLGATRSALESLGDRLESVEVDGSTLWFDPEVVVEPDRSRPVTFLLPTYDEVVLSYPDVNHQQVADHPHRTPNGTPNPFAAVIIHRGRDIGTWKRTVERTRVAVEIQLAPSVDDAGRAAVTQAAQRLASFVDRDLALQIS